MESMKEKQSEWLWGLCWYSKCGVLAIKDNKFYIHTTNMYHHLSNQNPKSK
jgi:hypothetical protein